MPLAPPSIGRCTSCPRRRSPIPLHPAQVPAFAGKATRSPEPAFLPAPSSHPGPEMKKARVLGAILLIIPLLIAAAIILRSTRFWYRHGCCRFLHRRHRGSVIAGAEGSVDEEVWRRGWAGRPGAAHDYTKCVHIFLLFLKTINLGLPWPGPAGRLPAAMNRCARNLRFWWLAPFGFIVVPLRPEPFCVRVPWSAATTPYWSVSWLPDGSLVAGTNQLVEFADDERRAEPAPGLSALRVLLPVSGTRLLAAGVGDATLFDRSTGVWRHDTGRALQKPASGIIDARISDDGASVVLAAIGSVQYVHGNRASEWAVPTLSRICLGRVSGRLAVCHPPYAVLGMTPRGPVERPDLAWADGAAMLLSAGGRIVGIFQGRIGVFHPDGTFLWEPSEAEKMLAEWVIDAGGDDRVLWIATSKGGIRWYDPATGGKIAEAHVSRELSGRICAVNQHPDGRLAVATESCLYVVYPPSVSSAPLPPGHFLFLRSCNGAPLPPRRRVTSPSGRRFRPWVTRPWPLPSGREGGHRRHRSGVRWRHSLPD